MDEIDRAKIGKKNERLVGWDHIRQKKLGTNYPPMRAKGAKPHYNFYTPSDSSGFFWIVIVVIAVVIGTKILGIW